MNVYHKPTRKSWASEAPASRCVVNFYTDGLRFDGQVGLSMLQSEIMAVEEVAAWVRRNVLTATSLMAKQLEIRLIWVL